MGFGRDRWSVGPGAAVARAAAMVASALGMMACTGQSPPLAGPPSASSTFVSPSPSVEPTPSQSASPEQMGGPTETPSRPPGTIPVYGTIRVRIVPLKPGPGMEAAPSVVTMAWVAPAVPGSEVRQVVQFGASGDFRMVLSPFDIYVLDEIEPTGGPFGFDTSSLPGNGPGGTRLAFAVPASGCAYIGRMTFTYIRVPGQDAITQLGMASRLAHGGSLAILFTSAGTLVFLPDDASAHRVELPPVAQRPPDARRCAVTRVQFRDLSP